MVKLLAMALLLAAGALATAEERVAVELRVVGTEPDGATTKTGDGTTTLSVGDSGHTYVAVGFVGESGEVKDTLCMNATGAGRSDRNVAETAAHVWVARARLLDALIDRITLEIEWQRFDATGRGGRIRGAGDSRTITLQEGQHHVLDFLTMPEGSSSCYRNVTVELAARVAEDPALRSARLRYDVWLQHRRPDGSAERRRFQAIGLQGEDVEFRFGALRFPVRGRSLPNGREVETVVEVSGKLRGRVREDGRIAVLLDADRWIDVVFAGEPRSGGVGDGGRKAFEVSSGETVRLDLPAPGGGGTIGVTTRGAGTVARQEEGEIHVAYREFFEGHADALIVTIRQEG